MRSSLFVSCVGSLAALAAAAPQATSTASAPAVTHTITAGNGNFAFIPHVTNASVGDVIEWQFFPLNHSVVRSAYGGNPCIPIQDTGSNLTAFSSPIYDQQYSGFTTPPIFTTTVNDTNPIWFYCSTIGSCNTKGMVGVINPAPGQSWDNQYNLALKAPYVLQPGQSPPSEGSTPTPTATPTPSKGLSTGAIAGIVVGAVGGLALIGALFFFVGRSKTYSDMLHGTRTHKRRGPPAAPAPPSSAPAFNSNPEMGMYQQQQHDDWKGPHSALTSPAFPPPYASPDQQFAHPNQPHTQPTSPGYPPNIQQYHDNRGTYTANRPPGLSRFSELGPSPSHQDRNIHELDTPLVSPPMPISPMKFDGEYVRK